MAVLFFHRNIIWGSGQAFGVHIRSGRAHDRDRGTNLIMFFIFHLIQSWPVIPFPNYEPYFSWKPNH